MSMTDTFLLERWTRERDAEAFREIVSRHAGMVYGTCTRILGDAAEAEDVSQQCFETLARAGAKKGAYLGAWLHRVATNMSLNQLRAERRRREREQRFFEASEPAREAAHGAAHGADWNDVRPYVDEAIAELAEKLRYPIVAHFLEQQTHEQISRKLGISRQTVMNRISKGIEEVRQNLAKRGVPIAAVALAVALEANAFVTAPETLLAQLGKMAVSGLVAGAAINAGRWALMKTVVVAAAAIVGAGIVMMTFFNPGGKTVKPVATVETPARVQPAVEPAAAQAEIAPVEKEEAAVPVEELLRRNVTGVVVDAEGAPVEGATVWAVLVEITAIDPRETTSDANGEFSLRLEKGRWAVRARKSNLSGKADNEYGMVEVKLDEALSPVTIHLAEQGSLRGCILDAETGNPIPGAAVWLDEGVLLKADAAGRYEYEGIEETNHYLFAIAPGYARERRLMDNTLRKNAQLDLRLERGGRVWGKVTNEAGEPVGNARVGIMGSGNIVAESARTTLTDAQGRYEYDGVEFDKVRTLSAGAAGYGEKESHLCITPNAPVAEVNFVLQVDKEDQLARLFEVKSAKKEEKRDVAEPTLRDISGTVRNENDEPMANIEVRWGRPGCGGPGLGPKNFTDAEGRFRLVQVPAREESITVQVEGYAPAFPKAPGGGDATVDVKLEKGVSVQGVVRDAEGNPLGGVTAVPVLSDEACGDHIWMTGKQVNTDAEGRFAVSHLPSQNVYFDFLGEGLSAKRDCVLKPAPETNEITVEGIGAIRGRVVYPDGSPARDFRILIQIPKQQQFSNKVGGFYAGFDGIGISFTTDDGEFVVTDLTSGNIHRVVATAEGYGDAVQEPVEARPVHRLPPSGELVLQLQAAEPFEVRVAREEDGAPVAEALVMALNTYCGNASSITWGLDESSWNRTKAMHTDAEGVAAFAAVSWPDGGLIIRADGYARQFIDRKPGQGQYEVALRAESVLSGKLVDKDGKPLAEGRVVLSYMQGRIIHTYQTYLNDEKPGEFSFTELPAGHYKLAASRDPMALGDDTEEVDLGEGESREIVVQLK